MTTAASELPASVRHARAGCASAGIAMPADDLMGQRVRGLSAMRLGAMMLVCGIEGIELAGWMIDGLDISSRLVLQHDSPEHADAVAHCFNNDLRVTSHVQPLVEFLDDVSRHRFSMLVLADPLTLPDAAARAAAAVEDGGILVLTSDALPAPGSPFCVMHNEPSQRILVRRHPGNKPVRRGGRRRVSA